ncbi:MAG TPA: L-threonylcarbamoyladenylate synthase [Candidatus Bathyarchaeia archaeon]|nr:L-threonylcarbamoyladenylate synthase [Candidatus Bathyarchaeia archaeon]
MVRILRADPEGFKETAAAVSSGKLVCYPTDTVYGIGCDPFNVGALDKLIRAKGDRTKPLPILVRSLDEAEKLGRVSDKVKLLAQEFWPGPLTLILPARDRIPVLVAPRGTVGVRSPNNAICLNLLTLCGGSLVGTSANLSGHAPATSANEAVSQLGNHVEVILDGGRSTLGIASTVVDVSGELIVLRKGPISKDELLRCLRKHSGR